MPRELRLFEVEPIVTQIDSNTMDKSEIRGLRDLVRHTIEAEGLEADDQGRYRGLDKFVSESLGPVIPNTCARNPGGECLCSIKFRSGDKGNEVESAMIISCEGSMFESEDKATGFEENERLGCLEVHDDMKSQILDQLARIPKLLARAEEFRGRSEELGRQSANFQKKAEEAEAKAFRFEA